jgi:hypothetical protein
MPNYIQKVQISKSKPKKFSFLCTFKVGATIPAIINSVHPTATLCSEELNNYNKLSIYIKKTTNNKLLTIILL